MQNVKGLLVTPLGASLPMTIIIVFASGLRPQTGTQVVSQYVCCFARIQSKKLVLPDHSHAYAAAAVDGTGREMAVWMNVSYPSLRVRTRMGN